MDTMKILVGRTKADAERALRELEVGKEWTGWGMFQPLLGHRFEKVVVLRDTIPDHKSQLRAMDAARYLDELRMKLPPGRKPVML